MLEVLHITCLYVNCIIIDHQFKEGRWKRLVYSSSLWYKRWNKILRRIRLRMRLYIDRTSFHLCKILWNENENENYNEKEIKNEKNGKYIFFYFLLEHGTIKWTRFRDVFNAPIRRLGLNNLWLYFSYKQ